MGELVRSGSGNAKDGGNVRHVHHQGQFFQRVILFLLIRIVMKLRLSIPLVYLVLMLTAFRPWYRVHATLADGIFLVMLGCVTLSWIISLIRFARRALA